MAYNKKGFTVTELMIAISVFAFAIILVTTGVVFISRKFQQASVRVELEDASRNIHQQAIQSSRFSYFNIPFTEKVDGSVNLKASCIGDDMYIYDSRLDDVAGDNTKYDSLTPGLWLKRDPDGTCTSIDNSDAVNMLPANSRVLFFEYLPATGELTTLFVSADDYTYLEFPPGGLDKVGCNSTLAGREFCSVVKLTSYSLGRIK